MSTKTPRQDCPVCDSELTARAAQCPNCKTDLRLFSPASDIALEFYNEGLDLARLGDRHGAIDKMHGALAADPTLVDAYIVLGKLIAQAGATADLEQALLCWQRARAARPTEEQSFKLDHCTNTAEWKLLETARRLELKRRSTFLSVVAGGLGLAVVGGVLGYIIRPLLGTANSSSRSSLRSGSAARKATSTNRGEVASPDPIASVTEVLRRPDISVTRSSDLLVLMGSVQTQREKDIILAAAAYAAHTAPAKVDGRGLTVKPAYTPVAATRVARMLNVVIGGLERSSSDPLYKATVSVVGGSNKDPLRVNGSCTSSQAGAEITRLVKEIYPSANPVDVSGLVVRAKEASVVRQLFPVVPIVPRFAIKRAVVEKANVATAAGAAASPASPTEDQVYINLSTKTYTVQPGDTIYAIAQKYGRDKGQWQQLIRTNRGTIQRPNSIPAGTVLKLPEGWKSPKQALDENE